MCVGGSAAWAQEGDLSVFGGASSSSPASSQALSAPVIKMNGFVLELGSSGKARAQTEVSIEQALSDEMTAKISVEARAHWAGLRTYDVLPGETWIQFRGEHSTLTAGWQKIAWGRLDGRGVLDVLTPSDMRGGGLGQRDEIRLATPVLRWEYFNEQAKHDVVVLPTHTPSLLAFPGSSWSPIDREGGRILGVETTALSGVLASRGALDGAGPGGWGGMAYRFSTDLEQAGPLNQVSVGVTAGRLRAYEPVVYLDTAVRRTLMASSDPVKALSKSPYAFRAHYPMRHFVGADMEWAGDSVTVRGELGAFGNEAYVDETLSLKTQNVFKGGIGAEFFPFENDFRVTVQLNAEHRTRQGQSNQYWFSGELEHFFFLNQLRARLRFMKDVTEKDYYLNPEIAWIGLEPFELVAAGHIFKGPHNAHGVASPTTPGGFFQSQSMATIGIKGRF